MADLQMKGICEKCQHRLQPGEDVYVCPFDCTFCASCAASMANVCQNCEGELVPRPKLKFHSDRGETRINSVDKSVWYVWLTSIGVWLFIWVSGGISAYELQHSLGHKPNLQMIFLSPGVDYCVLAFLSPWVFFLSRRYPLQRTNWQRRLWLYLAGSIAFCLLHVGFRSVLYYVWDWRINDYGWAVTIANHSLNVRWILVQRVFLSSVVDDIVSNYTGVVLVAHAVWYYQNFREREMRATQLEAQLTKASLRALKSQLQPHFLFNTMHSISALMLTDVSAADKMMTRLSDFLRISLDNDEVQFTSLNHELEFANSYLEIEKVRFEDRLNLSFSIDPETRDCSVPHLLLQPIVENAIQHGISKRPGGGRVFIISQREQTRLQITVKNDGPRLARIDHKRLAWGLGLRATRERLQTIYGEDHSFSIASANDGEVIVTISIPFCVIARQTPYLSEQLYRESVGSD